MKKQPYKFYTAIAALVIVGLISCISKSDKGEQVETANSQQAQNRKAVMLPAFKMKDADGNIIDMASLKGKKVFVNLWATWCPPCKTEIPSIELLKSKSDSRKTAFVMLSMDEDFEVAKNFAKTNKMKLPLYYPAEGLPALFKTDGIPATFIFDEYGNMIKQTNGADDYDKSEYADLLNK